MYRGGRAFSSEEAQVYEGLIVVGLEVLDLKGIGGSADVVSADSNID